MVKLGKFAAAAVIVCLFSCSPHYTSAPEKAVAHDVAMQIARLQSSKLIQITSIDDQSAQPQPAPLTEDALDLAAGFHSVTVAQEVDPEQGTSSGRPMLNSYRETISSTLSFVATPGRTYEVLSANAAQAGSRVLFWVQDKASGALVAGRRPTQSAFGFSCMQRACGPNGCTAAFYCEACVDDRMLLQNHVPMSCVKASNQT